MAPADAGVGGVAGEVHCRRSANVLHRRLAQAGTWVARPELVQGLELGPHALDAALDALVLDGHAQFKAGAGYRLAGTPLARQALRQLLAGEGLNLVVLGRPQRDAFAVAVARRTAHSWVCYELAFPPAPDVPQRIVQAMAIMAAAGREADDALTVLPCYADLDRQLDLNDVRGAGP